MGPSAVRPQQIYEAPARREQRPGLAALSDYAREGDAIVVVGIDRLGRNAAEVWPRSGTCGTATSFCGRSGKASTQPTQPGEWWPASWRVWPNWSWNLAANDEQQPVRRGGHRGAHRKAEGA